MQSSKPQFDYQAILEACGIQNVNMKQALEEEGESQAKFREDLEKVRKLTVERDEKNEKLCNLKLTQKKHLYKLKQITAKTATSNKEQKSIQEEIAGLHQELQKQSDDFVRDMNEIDERLTQLYSQFEGETLESLIRDVNNELLIFRDNENQLQRRHDELKNSRPDLRQYERLTILKTIMDGYPDMRDIEDIERKIAEKRKNIQFLEAEYNKKMDQLKTFV